MEFYEVRDILRPVIPEIKDVINITELMDEMEFSATVEQSVRVQVMKHGMPQSSHLFFDAIRQKPRNFIRLMAALLKHGQNEIYDVIYHQIRFYFRDNPARFKKVKDLIESEEKRMGAVRHTPPEVNPVPRDGQEGEEPNGPPQPPGATGSSGVNEQERMPMGRGIGRGSGRGIGRAKLLQTLVSSQEPGGPHRGDQWEALSVRPRPTVRNNSEEIPTGANQNDEVIYSRNNPTNQGTPTRANQNLPQPISPSDNTDNALADVRISQLQANVYNKLANILNRPSTHQITERWWNYILDNCYINISRGEQKNIKKAENPGEELLDLLDERGYTIADLARLFEDMQMTDALNFLRGHQNKVMQTPARSEASPQFKADLARLDELLPPQTSSNVDLIPSMGIENQLDPSMMELYFKVLTEGREKQNTIRLMVVGHHGVGKTTLTKNLIGMPLDGTTSTNGIDLHEYKCIASSDGKFSTANSTLADPENIQRLAHVARSIVHLQESPKTDFDHSNSTSVKNEETHVKTIETDKEAEVNQPVSNTLEDNNEDSKSLEASNQNTKMPSKNASKFASAMKNDDSLEKTNIKENILINIWDFGGQFIFYATHQLFHSPRAVYLLVLDMTKALDEPVQDDDFPEGSNDRDVKSFCQFWMHSIHAYVGSSYGEPPVILVGTHLDEIEEDDKAKNDITFDYFEDVRKLFDGTPVLKHIQPDHFPINNFSTNPTQIQELGKCIINIAGKHTEWNQEIPVKWIPLENSLRERRNEKHVMFDEICEIDAANEVPIADRKEIQLFLIYHHLMGTLIYFNDDALLDFVVLDPQWLIDAFKCIITSQKFCKVRSDLRHLWVTLVTEAILDPKLVDEVWRSDNKNNNFYEHKDILLKYLNKLNIISKVVIYNEESAVQTELEVYLVPCLLRSRTLQNDVDAFLGSRKRKSTMTALAFAFENGFVLPSLYHRITAAAIKRWPVVEYKDKKLLYENIGIYRLDDAHCGVIELTDKTIEVWVVNLCGLDIDCRQSDILRRYVELVLAHELERCHRIRESQYKLCIRCLSESNRRGKCIKPIDTLKQGKCTPCPDLEDEHVLDVNLVLRQWFPDDDIQGPNTDWFSNGISSGTLSRKVTPRNLDQISKAVGCGWECLAVPLGLSDVDIHHIKEDYRYSVLQIYHMLTKWAEQNADEATLAVLLQMMKDNPDVKVEWDRIKNMVDEFLD